MTTLRVRLATAPVPDRADPWALYDAAGACVRRGADRPDAWPAADRVEVVLAASQLRIATITLPPIPPARVAGAAGFALEDQLAGPAAAHHLTVSAQAADGRVRIVVVARSLLAAIAAPRRGIARIIAEPELAAPIAGWRWCVGDEGGGFVRCADGSAFPVDGLPGEGALPAELALALSQSRRRWHCPAARSCRCRMQRCGAIAMAARNRNRLPARCRVALANGTGGRLRVSARSPSRCADPGHREAATAFRAAVRSRIDARRCGPRAPRRRKRR